MTTRNGSRQHPEADGHEGRPDGPAAAPMTAAQAEYLQMLTEEAQEPFDPGLTSAQASALIDQLEARTGRGPIRLRPVI